MHKSSSTFPYPMVRLIIFHFFLFFVFFLSAQGEKNSNFTWHKGQIQLTNGSKVTGEVSYNFVSDVLYFRNDRGEKTLSAQSVSMFSMTESTTSKTKTFYSLPFKDEIYQKRGYMFFQVIHEKGDLAILTKHMLAYEEGKTRTYHNPSATPGSINSHSTAQTPGQQQIEEIIYLGNSSGLIEKYASKDKKLKTYLKNTWGSGGFEEESDSDDRYKVLNKEAINLVLSQNNNEVRRYIKNNKNRINTMDELIRLVDFYSTL